jgi:nicotinate-nucleotide adenylyltransferase
MKTGLFFGSFNPIHTGHLAIAQYILNESDLQEIWFIVSPQNPFKDREQLMDEQRRLDMVRLSISDNPAFKVSDIEFTLEKPSYTANTLKTLAEKEPGREFTLLIGSDTLEQLDRWKNPETILSYPIIVYTRSKHHKNPYPGHAQVRILDNPLLDISATNIRRMIEEKKEIKYLVRDEIINLLKNS